MAPTLRVGTIASVLALLVTRASGLTLAGGPEGSLAVSPYGEHCQKRAILAHSGENPGPPRGEVPSPNP